MEAFHRLDQADLQVNVKVIWISQYVKVIWIGQWRKTANLNSWCGTLHWKIQLLILMPWVRPHQEILLRPSTQAAKVHLYGAVMVAVSQKLGRKCTVPSWKLPTWKVERSQVNVNLNMKALISTTDRRTTFLENRTKEVALDERFHCTCLHNQTSLVLHSPVLHQRGGLTREVPQHTLT